MNKKKCYKCKCKLEEVMRIDTKDKGIVLCPKCFDEIVKTIDDWKTVLKEHIKRLEDNNG